MTNPKPYDTSRYGKLYADAQRQEELLAPLTEAQRAEVRRLHQSTPWSLEECVRRVTHPLGPQIMADITPEGLDRLLAALKDPSLEAHDHQLGAVCAECAAEAEEPADISGLTSEELLARRPPWPLRALGWLYGHVCNAYARVLLRDPSFTISELRDLHGLADEELPPHLAKQAQRIITAEISRRTRKDY